MKLLDDLKWCTVGALAIIAISSGFYLTQKYFDPVGAAGPESLAMDIYTEKAATGQDAIFSAIIFSDSEPIISGINSGNRFKLHYGTDVSSSETTVNGTRSGSTQIFEFTVPNSGFINTLDVNDTFEYYYSLQMEDGGSTIYLCDIHDDTSGMNTSTDLNECKVNNPYNVSIVASGTTSVAGTTLSGTGSVIGSVILFAEGIAKQKVTSNASTGAYSITSLPNGINLNILAFKEGYPPNSRYEYLNGTVTGIDIQLTEGNFGGGDGPLFMFSGPQDWSNGVGLDESIRVGFGEELDTDSINSNTVYLKKNDGTAVAGTITYCENNQAEGCSSLFEQDFNTILFEPTNDLTANTSYTFTITAAVTGNTSGMPVQGNISSGGHEIHFTTMEDSYTYDNSSYASGGSSMPPYPIGQFPPPGSPVSSNSNLIIWFNEPLDSSTVNTSNFKLLNSNGSNISIDVSLDSDNTKQYVTINPLSNLPEGDYELRALGAISNIRGITMFPPDQSTGIAWESQVYVSGNTDSSAPTVFSFLGDNDTANINTGFLEFGFDEPIDPSTVTTSNISLIRGSGGNQTTLTFTTDRSTDGAGIFIIPTDILNPGTSYTVSFTEGGIKDLAGNGIGARSFTITTASEADNSAPTLIESQCDDYSCSIKFNEPINNSTNLDGSTPYGKSILNPDNITLQLEDPSNPGSFLATDYITSNIDTIYYEPTKFSVIIEGLSASDSSTPMPINRDGKFKITISTNVKDLSDNAISSTNNANIFIGTLNNSLETFGSFSNDFMFGPPTMAGAAGGGNFDMDFKMEGFGNFSGEDMFFGDGIMAYPFNQMAGMDCNVFQVNLPSSLLETAIVDGDQFIFTFPNGTDVSGAVPDQHSPAYSDFSEFDSGTITFDTSYSSDGISTNSSTREVTVQVAVTGTTTQHDQLMIDLRGITNPNIPKGPDSGGYTLGIKLKRNNETIANLTSSPYFINSGGSNTITVDMFAGSQSSPVSGANGDIFMFGGGPAGPMDKNITLSNGNISAIDGTSATEISYTNLPDGCYNFGTEPFVTLGGSDYFGQDFFEPTCVFGGETKTVNIVLAAASGSNVAATVTVKIVKSGGFTNPVDIDIFAGGPGRFVVKTLSDITTPDSGGYDISLPIDGFWHIGIGPAMPKTGGMPDFDTFGAIPPPPFELEVINGEVHSGFHSENMQGVTFDNTNNILTFTVRTSNIEVPVTVTDGTNPLQNVDVFIHQFGMGQGDFRRTNNNGQATLKLADYGPAEIGTIIPGLGETHKDIDIKEVNGATKIYLEGELVNTVTLKIKKADYYISGKVLNTNGNGMGDAPVWAENDTGEFISGGTKSDGSYILYVPSGTWTLHSNLPPDQSAVCATFEKEVTVTDSNKTNQTIEPTAGTCFTLSGTVTINGNTQANMHVFAEEWDTSNNTPEGGMFRDTNTNSSGTYSLQLTAPSSPGTTKTYRVGFWDPEYGEVSEQTTISYGSTTATLNLNPGTLETITFAFTGGSSDIGGFVEVKSASDKYNRINKQINGTDENITLNVKNGNYKYFVDLFGGAGKYEGTVSSGGTVTIDLSSTELVTLSGTLYDSDGNAIPGARVMIDNFNNNIHADAQTDENGAYSINIKTGDYQITASRAGYIAGAEPETLSITENTTYNFGGDNANQIGMKASTNTIEGVIYKSDGSTPITDGFVWAKNSEGLVVSTQIKDSIDGTYSLPVTEDSTWTVHAGAPLHTETELSSSIDTTDEIPDTNKNFTLSSDPTNIPKSKTETFNASSTISLNDLDNSDMQITAAGGVIASSGTVDIQLEKSTLAPEDASYAAVGDHSYDLNVTVNDQVKKDFGGNIEIKMEYDPNDLPSGISEEDLTPSYFNANANAYVPCEGGALVDTENNIVTCIVNHATTFAIVYASSSVSSGGGGRRGGHYTAPSTDTIEEGPTEEDTGIIKETVEEESEEIIDAETLKKLEEAYLKEQSTNQVLSYDDEKEEVTKAPAIKAVFKDILKHWARKYIEEMQIKGIVQGISSTKFGPDLTVTNAQTLKMALKAFKNNIPDSNKSYYSDVNKGKWYTKYVNYAKETNIIPYPLDRMFRPDEPSTRVDALRTIFNAAGLKVGTKGKLPFNDVPKDSWYYNYVGYGYEKGFIKGFDSKTFGPLGSITRAQISKILSLVMQYLEK